MATVIERRPPEDPPQNLNVLRLHLFGAEDLVRVLGAIVAAQAQTAARQAIQVFHPEHAVVFEGVHFPVDDLHAAAINADQRTVLNLVRHAVADHRHANRVVQLHVHGFKHASGQAHFVVMDFADGGPAGALRLQFGVDRHFQFFAHASLGPGWLAVWRLGNEAVLSGVLWALAAAQPTRVDAQQFSDFFNARHGDAALEPVVHVLRRNFSVGGKVRCGEMALSQKAAQSIT